MLYWNPKYECIDREELEALQLARLKETVERVYNNVKPYREKMQAIGMMPGDIKSLDDLKLMPFTTKIDLRDNYPFGYFGAPLSDIIRIHASTGTTGKPTVAGYTRKDIGIWADIAARSIVAAGGGPDDIIQVSYGYGLFTGGLGMHYGGELLGASVLPTSAGNSHRQMMLMRDFGCTILCCTPSYALYLSEVMAEMNIKPSELKFKAGIFGAEPWTEGMRKELESRFNISAHNIYGLSEISGPGVGIDCEAKAGMHVPEDHFITEVINPDTGEVLPDGSLGELVFTCITKEGFPLIRYRTRDLTSVNREKCVCGRTNARLDRIMGRSDDMLIIRGVNVFPSQVESALLDLGLTSPHYHLVVDRVDNLDVLEVQVEVSDDFFSDEVRGLEGLGAKVRKVLDSTLGLGCKISLVEPKTLPRAEGKSVRVTDKRKLNF